MSDIKSDIDSEIEQNYSLNNTADPKNVQELTIYVSVYRIYVANLFELNIYLNKRDLFF